MAASPDVLRVAAIGDLHCTKNGQGMFQALFAQISDSSEVAVLCGDLTDYGLPEEARVLARDLTALRVPALGVLGNHDFESGKVDEVREILCAAGLILLDGDVHEIKGVGFAGVKGFGGGFGRSALQPWGEDAIKQFVREGVDEALRLESALARLRTDQRVAILHYAPIAATVAGEPPEIYPFLGSSRLEEPLARYRVAAAFHGHAHHGTAEGHTAAGVPVYNVALPLLWRAQPDRPPFRVVEIPLAAPAPVAG